MNVLCDYDKNRPAGYQWQCIDDDTYDVGRPVGWGVSRDAAVIDLIDRTTEFEEAKGMTLDEAKDLVSRLSIIATELFNRFGSLDRPIFHWKGDNGESILSPEMDNKDMAMAVIRWMLEKDNAVWVMIIAEAWKLEGKEGDLLPVSGSLAGHPQRKEVISYTFEHEVLGMVAAEQEISRGEDGKGALGPLEWKPMKGEHEGRMVGMLPAKKAQS